MCTEHGLISQLLVVLDVTMTKLFCPGIRQLYVNSLTSSDVLHLTTLSLKSSAFPTKPELTDNPRTLSRYSQYAILSSGDFKDI